MGLPSLYPAIFSPEPVEDLVSLHCMLFALQYASGMAWLDCGVAVDTIIGHSFGQLTALVLAGGLSLKHGLQFVAERARLIQSHWGQETGAMLSIQGDWSTVEVVLEKAKRHYPSLAVEVACYNGPQTIVLAGDRASIDAVEEVAGTDNPRGHLKVVRLRNTHAFHSRLVEGILPGLLEVAATLEFRQPLIKIESCSPDQDWNRPLSAEQIVQHSRRPVHFHDAVLRAVDRLGACGFLEAGSASPVVAMTRRSLEASAMEKSHVFQPIDIGSPNSRSILARATSSLWAAGVKVQHWPFHSNKGRYSWINLPPYQFEKVSHWVEYLSPKALAPDAPQVGTKVQEQLRQLLTLHEQKPLGPSTFTIDTTDEMFVHCTKGHAVLGQSLCPASMYVEVAIRAASSLAGGKMASAIPSVKNLKISSPLSIGSSRSLFLQIGPVDGKPNTWEFSVFSRAQPSAISSIKHAAGSVSLRSEGSPFDDSRMKSIRRLVSQGKVDELVESRGSHSLSGNIIYQVFGQVVNYAPYYQGVTQILSRGQEAVGFVKRPDSQVAVIGEDSCDPIMLDNFLQVAGIHVNCLSEKSADEVFVCTEIGELVLGGSYTKSRRDIESYKAYSCFDRCEGKILVNDIFVFDSRNGELVALVLGAIFQSVPMKSLAKTLAKLNGGATSTTAVQTPTRQSLRDHLGSGADRLPKSIAGMAEDSVVKDEGSSASQEVVLMQVRELFSRVLEVPMEEVKGDTTLAFLGVDSLMSTEIISEIKRRFDINIPSEAFSELVDVQSVSHLLCQNEASIAIPRQQQRQGKDQNVRLVQVSDQDDTVAALETIRTFLSQLLDIPSAEITADTSLDSLGIDSLMATEVLSELRKHFDVQISSEEFTGFQDVKAIAKRLHASYPLSSGTLTPESSDDAQGKPHAEAGGYTNGVPKTNGYPSQSSLSVYDSFAGVREAFDPVSREENFADFYTAVYPAQRELVVAYVVEAFDAMGSSLTTLKPRDRVRDIAVLDKHQKVKRRIYEILEDARIIERHGLDGGFFRTATPVPGNPSRQLHQAIVVNFPQHAFEHNLLASTGSQLADCLTGKVDPLVILFGSADARELMGNVYAHAPMFKTGTVLLARYLMDLVERRGESGPVRILELGAGTGGTTKYLLECLVNTKATLEYTFTDISSSLVAAARKKFSQYSFMRYATLNIEQQPQQEFLSHYDIVISTNCIHATADLTRSCANINAVLRPDGVLCLVELTRSLFWFDLVFGLLEGWWLFEDGRQYALADEALWKNTLSQSGFRWTDWTRGSSEESHVLRVITASPSDMEELPAPTMETVVYGRATTANGGDNDDVVLEADIYYPAKESRGVEIRPVGEHKKALRHH